MYCPDDIVTLVNNSECDAFDPLCDYDGYDCCKNNTGRFKSIMFRAVVDQTFGANRIQIFA